MRFHLRRMSGSRIHLRRPTCHLRFFACDNAADHTFQLARKQKTDRQDAQHTLGLLRIGISGNKRPRQPKVTTR